MDNSSPNSDPEILYHYCSNATLCSIIQNKSIWLSSLSMSNDSMEGRWLKEVFRKACEDSRIKEIHIPEIMRLFTNLEYLSDSLGFCLSEQGDVLSQWRGYADDAAGVSIGFSFSYLNLISINKEENGLAGHPLQKVIYGTREKSENLEQVIREIEGFSEDGAYDRTKLSALVETSLAEKKFRSSEIFPFISVFRDMFKFKNPAFSEEKEWRLMWPSPRVMAGAYKYRSAGSRIIPYREYSFDMVKEQPLVEIILGPKNTSDEIDIERLLLANGFENVVVKRSAATYR